MEITVIRLRLLGPIDLSQGNVIVPCCCRGLCDTREECCYELIVVCTRALTAVLKLLEAAEAVTRVNTTRVAVLAAFLALMQEISLLAHRLV